MPASGTDLGSDLKSLMEIAHIHIPKIATVYEKAACDLATTDHENEAFNQISSMTWIELYKHYIRLMSESQANLQDTAVALTQTVNAYIEQDQEARTQLKDLIEDEHKGDIDEPQGGTYQPPDFPEPIEVDVDRQVD